MKPFLFFTFLLVVLGFMACPPILKAKKNANKARAICHAKNLGIAMTEFDSIYDHYPHTKIPEDLLEKYPQTDRTDSNYILGQLIASEATDSEQIFDNGRSRGFSTKADDIISPLSELLRAGECEFSCVTLEGDRPVSSAHSQSSTPLIFNHIIPGTNRFDPECYNGAMVYLRGDNSVSTAKINSEGQPMLRQSQKTFFETGPDTVWGNDTPVLHHPLSYEISHYDRSPILKKQFHPVAAVSLIVLVGFSASRRAQLASQESSRDF